MKKTPNLHDRGYKRLFSNKTFVSKLFHGFVLEKWVKDIDFRKLERVETSFISKKFAKRESDILYKVKYKLELSGKSLSASTHCWTEPLSRRKDLPRQLF